MAQGAIQFDLMPTSADFHLQKSYFMSENIIKKPQTMETVAQIPRKVENTEPNILAMDSVLSIRYTQ